MRFFRKKAVAKDVGVDVGQLPEPSLTEFPPHEDGFGEMGSAEGFDPGFEPAFSPEFNQMSGADVGEDFGAEPPEFAAAKVTAASARPGLMTRLRASLRKPKAKPGSPDAGNAKTKRDDLKFLAAKKSITTSPDVSKDDPGTLTFGNRKVALGLQWIAAEDGQSMKEVLSEMSDHSTNDPTQISATFKFYTDVRKTGFIGVGSPDLGHTAGMRVLITMLSPQLTGPRWIGAFPLGDANDTWWVGSMRDGKVFSDQIVASRNQAEEILHQDLQAPDWTAVFAPLDWGITEARSERLYELVDLRIGEKFKSISPIKDNLPRALMGVMVAGITIGGFLYYQERKAEELRALEELRRKAEQGMTFGPSDLPWFKSTDIATFISVCSAQIDKSLVTVPGWENQPISCSIKKGEGTISTGWARNGGRSAMLRATISPDLPAPVLAENAETASWSVPFDAPYQGGDMAVKPWEPEVLEARVRERFQNLDLPLAIRSAGGNIKRATNKVIFNAHELRLSSSFGFANFGDMLSDIPAVVPDALIYSPATGKWDLAIKVFHPPIIPPPQN